MFCSDQAKHSILQNKRKYIKRVWNKIKAMNAELLKFDDNLIK